MASYKVTEHHQMHSGRIEPGMKFKTNEEGSYTLYGKDGNPLGMTYSQQYINCLIEEKVIEDDRKKRT